MALLVLLRHGESVWNAEDRFAGWEDIALTSAGCAEARQAGRFLASVDALPDVVHTSVLRRAIMTADIALDASGRHWIPAHRSWRLNERHYGAVQGMSRDTIRRQYGDGQYRALRRSFDLCPPPISDQAALQQQQDPRYRDVPIALLPRSESLEQMSRRLMPYWTTAVKPDLSSRRVTCVVSHGNSLRMLIMHLEGQSSLSLADIDVPTGTPILYDVSNSGRIKRLSP